MKNGLARSRRDSSGGNLMRKHVAEVRCCPCLRFALPLAVVVIAFSFQLAAAGAEADLSCKPNVLFIAVDDLRDWVGHLGGHPQAKTPNIDRLARRGVSFTQAYCSAPLCNPSRISLLTGIAPSKSGVYGNGEKLRDKLPKAITLMQHFRASGYTVRGSGKIFHGTNAYDQPSWDEYFVPSRSRVGAVPPRDKRLPKTAWTPWGRTDLRDEEMFDGQGCQLGSVRNGEGRTTSPSSWLAD